VPTGSATSFTCTRAAGLGGVSVVFQVVDQLARSSIESNVVGREEGEIATTPRSGQYLRLRDPGVHLFPAAARPPRTWRPGAIDLQVSGGVTRYCVAPRESPAGPHA